MSLAKAFVVAVVAVVSFCVGNFSGAKAVREKCHSQDAYLSAGRIVLGRCWEDLALCQEARSCLAPVRRHQP